jgi:DDE superfamily endonuclease
MASGKINAARLKASLVFIDESGFMMAPLVRRTWAPRGATPIMLQRGRSHEKVSAIAALVVSPRRDNVRFFFRLHPDENIKTPLIVSFLRQLSRQLGKRTFLVVWDRLNAHRAKATTVCLKKNDAVVKLETFDEKGSTQDASGRATAGPTSAVADNPRGIAHTRSFTTSISTYSSPHLVQKFSPINHRAVHIGERIERWENRARLTDFRHFK